MKISRKRILAVSGSTKSKSTSLSILQYIADTFHDSLDVEIYNRIERLPHFNPELENEKLPDEVGEFRELIQRSDGVLFCTPEYVYSLPGSLKNAIEWNVSTTLFSGKPVAIIIAAASGEKAFESLGLILTTIEAHLPAESRLLIKGAKGIFDGNGMIKKEGIKKDIERVIESLVRSIEEGEKHTIYHPDLSKFRPALFWDTSIEKIDWEKQKNAVIKRVFDRGNQKERDEIIRFYGKATVEKILRKGPISSRN